MPLSQFFVPGKPQPAGSKKAFPYKKSEGGWGASVVDANPNQKSWQARVSSVAMDSYDGALIEGPVLLQLIFLMERPKSHFRTGKYSHLLKDSAPVAPHGKPDVLKLGRAVEDALSGVIYHDDSQVTTEFLMKRYWNRFGVIIRGDLDDTQDEEYVRQQFEESEHH